ncbi:uncharacterized protein LOC112693381 isoform X2 [Sipha flava]|uniref:Uncharacterized protein LOC112693381 isoform X2 n=1 Tax=Sipha flava TaxID=143950 RepID=A0A8B8GMK5_9HEMI|nr:uncharacterized protein LOC112693381 isoform X2 [Sipha flava]
MDPAIVYEEIRSMQRKMDIMDKKMDKVDRQRVETSGQMNAIAIMLRTIDDTLRKSANSISLIVRMVSGMIDLSSSDLGKLLLENNALLGHVQLNPDWNSELSPFAGYPPMHALKLMLTELIQIIDKHRLDNFKIPSEIVPITAPSVSCITKNTIVSSQNESSTVLPVMTEETSMLSNTSSQNNNSEVLPIISQESNMVSPSSNITPLHNSIISNLKNKNEEDEGALRRKYKNKYRYLNVSKALSTEPKKHIICRDSSYIPEPYRNPIFDNVKAVKITNYRTNKSVIKPLSFIHPRVVINSIDVANCAAIAPRIKKNIKFKKQVMKTNRKSLRIAIKKKKSTSKDKDHIKNYYNKSV